MVKRNNPFICLLAIFFSLLAVASSAPKPQTGQSKVLYFSLHQENLKFVEEWTYCFDHVCRCKGDMADCSQSHGGLIYVPKFPNPVTFLNFSFNSVGKLPVDFFANVTTLTSVDLSSNALVLLSPAVFRLVPNLTRVFIGNNLGLNYKTLEPVFFLPALQVLDLADGNLGSLQDSFFHKHPLPNLRKLNLYGNYLLLDNLADFSVLDNLVELNLGLNDITVLKTGAVLGVQELNLEKNSLSQFPKTCGSKTSLFPVMTRLILRQNRINNLAKDICLPVLEYLDLGQNSISMLLKNGFMGQLFPGLRELYLDSMATGIQRMESVAFNSPTLEILSLSDNKLDFDFYSVDPECFQGCPNLTTLQLDRNFFTMSDKYKTAKLFRSVAGLHELNLTDVSIMSNLDSDESFVELPDLSQLSLSNNVLYDLQDGIFDKMMNLKFLDLSNNGLSAIQESTFNASTRQRLEHLDLSGNSFICTCELRWFGKWLNSVDGRSLFNNSASNYTCTCYDCWNIEGWRETPFMFSDQACMLSDNTYGLIMAFTLFSYMGLFCILYCLRKKYRVRKAIRGILGGNNNNNNNRQEGHAQANYHFDLFVAYAEGDEEWVRGQLMPELEERRGLRLCIHQRDFHPGRHILDSIESSVALSRRVMMVFSPHFARSEWCQFELTLCQRHVMDRGDLLLVVLLRDVPDRDLTPGMMAILRTSTYLQWSQDRRDVVYFWDNLRLALHDLIHRNERQ